MVRGRFKMGKKSLKPYEALYPVPVVLVSSAAKGSRPNIITIAWAGVVCSGPPTVSISIRPSRHSHKLIKESGEFVINIPDIKHLRETDYCGLTSGRTTDKFKECAFTAKDAGKVKAPLIAECPVNIECKVKDIISLGAHDMFIGEVVSVNADESVLNDFGSVDYAKTSPIIYKQGQYWSVGKRIGEYGFSRKAKSR